MRRNRGVRYPLEHLRIVIELTGKVLLLQEQYWALYLCVNYNTQRDIGQVNKVLNEIFMHDFKGFKGYRVQPLRLFISTLGSR